MRLKDKVAIVTGGSSGIGEGIARRFAQEGANVVIAARRLERAETVVASIRSAGGEATAVQADVRNFADHELLVRATVERYGGLDILVNNAGIFLQGLLEEVEERLWDKIFDTNVKGMYFLTQRAVVEMRKQGKGKIINITSQAGETSFPRSSVYSTSKAAVIGLTRALAVELAPAKINVNAIGPSNVETPLNSNLIRLPSHYDFVIDHTPYGRLSTVDDVAPAAVYLASDESDFVCGITIHIDGGWLAQ